MRPVVLAHVDELSRPFHGIESRFADRFRFAYKRHHRTVCGLARIHVEQPDAFVFFHFVCNQFDDFHVAPFAEIGDALNKFLLHITID